VYKSTLDNICKASDNRVMRNICSISQSLEPKSLIESWEWTPESAYILGFFAADGTMTINPRGSKYIEFVSNDYEILEKVCGLLGASQKISTKTRLYETSALTYRVQIGSKYLFDKFTELGFLPNKSKVLKFPELPKDLIRHFVRGYFDGDGCVSYRLQLDKRYNKLRQFLTIRFICGNRHFLEELQHVLRISAQIGSGSISRSTRSYQLQYRMKDSIILFGYFYKNVSECFLIRKHQILKKAVDEISGGVV